MATSKILTWDGSNHNPIILYFQGDSEAGRRDFREGSKLFRFEARWLQHEDFDSCVRNSWLLAKSRSYGQWSKVVEDCGIRLKDWHKEVYMSSQNRVGWLLRRLKKVRKMVPTVAVIEESRKVEQDLRILRQHQETAA